MRQHLLPPRQDLRPQRQHGEAARRQRVPRAIGVTVAADARSNGEFFCVVERIGESQTDEMTVMVEVPDLQGNGAAVKSDLEMRLKETIGVRVTVQPAGKGDLDKDTGTSQTTKLKRLLDNRK
jgi:phenylacetate-CoA ligase